MARVELTSEIQVFETASESVLGGCVFFAYFFAPEQPPPPLASGRRSHDVTFV